MVEAKQIYFNNKYTVKKVNWLTTTTAATSSMLIMIKQFLFNHVLFQELIKILKVCVTTMLLVLKRRGLKSTMKKEVHSLSLLKKITILDFKDNKMKLLFLVWRALTQKESFLVAFPSLIMIKQIALIGLLAI